MILRVRTLFTIATITTGLIAALAGCSNTFVRDDALISSPPVDAPSIVSRHAPVPALALNVWQRTVTHARTSFVASPNATGTFIYGCGYDSNACVWYRKGHREIAGEITDLDNPEGIGVNPFNGDVYVANTGGSDIRVYPPNSTTLIADYPDPGEYPADVAVDENGAFYVANTTDTSGGGGSVTVYNSSGNIVRKLQIPFADFGVSVAVDERHQVAFCGRSGLCYLFAHAREPAIPFAGFAGFAGGSSFNGAEHLVVINQLFDKILTFASGNLCGTLSLSGIDDPVMLAIAKQSRDVYVSDATSGSIIEYEYFDCTNNSFLSPLRSYKLGLGPTALLIGTAVTPGIRP